MTKRKAPWRCQKCDCLGITIPRASSRSVLCRWCTVALRKAGQQWCSKGRHGVAQDLVNRGCCKACRTADNAERHAANREHNNAYALAYHAAHRDQAIATSRAYYAAHRQQILVQKRDYYQQNREQLLIKGARYRRIGRTPESVTKSRARHRAKYPIYYAHWKLSRARRWLASLRGVAS